MIALLFGLAFGFFGSIPVAGPISAVVLERALAHRGRSAFLVALGGALAEGAYAFLAAWGLGGAIDRFPGVLLWSQRIGSLLLLVLGTVFLLRPPTFTPGPKPSRWQQSGAFLFGLLVTALNPTLLVTWTAAVTALVGTGQKPAALPFALGACVGIVAWFSTLLGLVATFHTRMGPQVIGRLVRGTGALLIGLGAWMVWRAW